MRSLQQESPDMRSRTWLWMYPVLGSLRRRTCFPLADYWRARLTDLRSQTRREPIALNVFNQLSKSLAVQRLNKKRIRSEGVGAPQVVNFPRPWAAPTASER